MFTLKWTAYGLKLFGLGQSYEWITCDAQHADEMLDLFARVPALFTVWIRNRMAYRFALFRVAKTPSLSGVHRARAEARPAR